MTEDKEQKQERQTLTFESDEGASRSIWIAAVILIAIVAWMGSGFLLPSKVQTGDQAKTSEPQPVAVTVRTSIAESVTLYFQAEGQAQPDRDTALRAESSGDVAEVLVNKGDDVLQGDIIARLTTNRVQADLRREIEARDSAQREFDNANELRDRGVATVDRVTEARAALAAAEADVAAAQEALESTNIVAPFTGRIETLSLDEGEYISAGSDVGRIVDNQPLTVALQVPQQALNRIRNGQTAEVNFITGEEREGSVTFVSTSASAETRTFLAEIEVPNSDGAIPAGISAEISIPTGTEKAHFVTPSVVSLSPDGVTGVKSVEDNKVVFYEIQVVRAEVDGIWVTGLPDTAQIIIIGQGFVREGEAIKAQPERAESPAQELAREAGE
ncbi:efflux RND transporter periplasmic adaptor subunit [Pararhizobium sp. IMCC21322]|uniref:efflux RND transporter periplasmic adaptor subunit n=1 Tax=Pararhizobium sp. IMCC21322 TaxID=3067903 RepID=UPI00274239BC|nr:efflux RND transporter periplasmic adaptor subunit [Pararhizobium sp. IMCC21322]